MIISGNWWFFQSSLFLRFRKPSRVPHKVRRESPMTSQPRGVVQWVGSKLMVAFTNGMNLTPDFTRTTFADRIHQSLSTPRKKEQHPNAPDRIVELSGRESMRPEVSKAMRPQKSTGVFVGIPNWRTGKTMPWENTYLYNGYYSDGWYILIHMKK